MPSLQDYLFQPLVACVCFHMPQPHTDMSVYKVFYSRLRKETEQIQVSYVTPPLTHTCNLRVEQPTASVSEQQVGSFKDTESRKYDQNLFPILTL